MNSPSVLLWLATVAVIRCPGTTVANRRHREYQLVVQEEAPVGTEVGDVASASGLTEKYSMDILKTLRYQFLNQPPVALTIEEETGMIRTGSRIDREAVCSSDDSCRVRLDVAVRPMSHFQIIKIVVEILDVNDNSPIFRPDFKNYDVSESALPGLGLPVQTATDLDSAHFSVERYQLLTSSIAGPEHFELKQNRKLDGSTDLKLILVHQLDRELQQEHHLKLVAYDGGTPSRTGTADITINVQDANDNIPIFDRATYEDNLVVENAPHMTTVVRVQATDRDIGSNGQIRYSLSQASATHFGGTFAVNNVTGDVYVIGDVDYEANPAYRLMVTAQDCGSDVASADALVIIKVEDVNDNTPSIIVNTLSASATRVATVPEDVEVGTFVAHVIVSDPDSGRNGRSNCSLKDDNFRLHRMLETEYQLVTTRLLDRERQSAYTLDIICQDNGRPPLWAQMALRIEVADVNDNSPRFLQGSYSAELLENNYLGASIVQVSAVDTDSGNNSMILYRLEDSEYSRYVSVDKLTGLVSAKSSFDHEQTPQLKFNVLATDRGAQPRTGSVAVVVNVLDVNDARPQFLAPAYSLGLDENLPAGFEVGIVSALDADDYPYNQFSFAFQSSGSLSDAFTINSKTGRITTTRSLDREQQETYYLIAVAKDDQEPEFLSGTASVTIYVMDVNDNRPVFVSPPEGENASIAISPRTRIGTTITQVLADDADAGENADILYKLENNEDTFSIDPVKGTISLAADIRYSPDNLTFTLVVRATDKGSAPLSTLAYITVAVDKTVSVPLSQITTSRSGSSSGNSGGRMNYSTASVNHAFLVVVLSGASALVLLLISLGGVIFCIARKQHRAREKQRRALKHVEETKELEMDELGKFASIGKTRFLPNHVQHLEQSRTGGKYRDHCSENPYISPKSSANRTVSFLENGQISVPNGDHGSSLDGCGPDMRPIVKVIAQGKHSTWQQSRRSVSQDDLSTDNDECHKNCGDVIRQIDISHQTDVILTTLCHSPRASRYETTSSWRNNNYTDSQPGSQFDLGSGPQPHPTVDRCGSAGSSVTQHLLSHPPSPSLQVTTYRAAAAGSGGGSLLPSGHSSMRGVGDQTTPCHSFTLGRDHSVLMAPTIKKIPSSRGCIDIRDSYV